MAAFLEELKADAERHGHRANVTFHGHPIVTVRPAAFKRCLGNLVSNAARHAPSIAITGHRDHRWLTVTVDDDGPGIPVNMREEVFKPFLRLDDARNQDEGGTGLGLAIARDIARSHGGDITLGDHRWAACARRCGCRCRRPECAARESWGPRNCRSGFPLRGIASQGLRRVRFRRAFVAARGAGAAHAADAAGMRHRSSSKPDQRWPRASASVERRHRAGEAFIVVVEPGAQHRGEQHRQSLARAPCRADRRADVGGGQHPALRAHRQAVERERQAGIARAERSSERIASL